MAKKIYHAPCADLIFLVPEESVANGPNWFWNVYQKPTESTTGVPVNIWEQITSDSYKFDGKSR